MYKYTPVRDKKSQIKLVISLFICIFIAVNKQVTKQKAMIAKDKITEIFCIIDEFDKNLNEELKNNLRLPSQHSRGEIPQKLTGANVDDRDDRVWNVFSKVLYGKVFADRGYISCIHVIVLYTTSS